MIQPHFRTSRPRLAVRAACARPVSGVDIRAFAPAEASISLTPICMETTSKKKKDVPSAKAENKPLAASPAANAPIKTFRIEDVSVGIFARERQYQGVPTVFYSASFSRSYKDAAGERKFTKSFDLDDLGKVVELSQRASEFMQNLRENPAAAEL